MVLGIPRCAIRGLFWPLPTSEPNYNLRACLEKAIETRSTGFGVPPLGGEAWKPPKGGTPIRISKHALSLARGLQGLFRPQVACHEPPDLPTRLPAKGRVQPVE